MWQVDNRTPFAADRGWVRDRDGCEVWLVAVKASFDIAGDGTTAPCAEQPPVLRLPEHHGEPGKSSLRYESDLVLTKKTTDVILVGHACAPAGTRVAQMDVGLRVGPVQKVLRVYGDREWAALSPSAPQPFGMMPLVYERAYGGADPLSCEPVRDCEWRNPVGTGFATTRQAANRVRLPNVEDPKRPIRSWSDRPPPAGFGPIPGHWPPRAELAGTYDDRWMKTRQPLLAEDLDDGYFQCAPSDQQSPRFLLGGEPVVLHGLRPEGDLRFVLPRLHFGFVTHFYDGTREMHRQRQLHTVILEPDLRRVSLVWHTSLRCHWKVQKLERTTITLKQGLGGGERTADVAEPELA